MSKSNYTVQEWVDSAKEMLTPDGRKFHRVTHMEKGEIISLRTKEEIQVFAGEFPQRVSQASNWYRMKRPSAVLYEIGNTGMFVLLICT